jgi:hypothetical protein
MGRRPSAPTVLRLDKDVVSDFSAPQLRRVTGSARRGRVGAEDNRVNIAELDLPSADRPFHFTFHISRLCADVCRTSPTFRHIDMRRVLVTFVRCRNERLWGLQAKLVPLRFQGGALTEKRRGRMYHIQQFYVGETQMYYVLSFYLPRFLNQTFTEKLITIFHELYHIGPEFTGDIRRFDGANWIHTCSQKSYDAKMAEYVKEYLAASPRRRLLDFLQLSFSQLQARHRQIVGVYLPAPKLVPVELAGR